jgi:predicted aconitase with swiveling domain
MKKIVLNGRKVVGGCVEGEALVSRQEISGFGSISNEKGVVTEPNHEIKGIPLKDKILVFPSTKGSAGFTYIFFRMKPFGVGPKGAIIRRMNSTSGWGFVFGNVPSVTDLDQDPLEVIATGDYIKLDADKGIVEVTKKA